MNIVAEPTPFYNLGKTSQRRGIEISEALKNNGQMKERPFSEGGYAEHFTASNVPQVQLFLITSILE